MAILSGATSTLIVASVTPFGGVAGAAPRVVDSSLKAPKPGVQDVRAPESSTQESSVQDGDAQSGDAQEEDSRPTGRPGRSLAALDIQTQTAAQNGTADESTADEEEAPTTAAPQESEAAKPQTNSSGEEVDENGLTEADRRQIEKLKQRDREVKEHERAHAAAGGGIAGQPNYKYVTGPDGNQYAVSGEVRINTTPVRGNPDATIRKLEQVKRAALAPSDPSGQDRRVAASAEAGIAAARREKAAQKREEVQENEEGRAARETGAASRSDRNAPGNEAVFDPEERFRNEIQGISETPQTGLAGAGALQTNVGLSDPGQLFSLVA